MEQTFPAGDVFWEGRKMGHGLRPGFRAGARRYGTQGISTADGN